MHRRADVKTARARPRRAVSDSGRRSALAHQRRRIRWLGCRRVEQPTDAELHVMRDEAVEALALTLECPVEPRQEAGLGGPEIEIAIGELDREIGRDLVGEA